ncbi:MAG: shikimate kinase [Desulfobacteraceae bacterium]|nr:shikimate kinase [Desulfobacteraceae bacterium]
MIESDTVGGEPMGDSNIYLIGYRCTGKTSLGKALAKKLGRAFLDTDDRIVAEEGVSITEMVRRHGWPYFRNKERVVVGRVADMDYRVVATGGGVVLDHINTAAMKASGRVIWLQAQPETIVKRIRADRRSGDHRPALTGNDLETEVLRTLDERRALYAAAMDLTIHTDVFNIRQLCDEIIKLMRKRA